MCHLHTSSGCGQLCPALPVRGSPAQTPAWRQPLPHQLHMADPRPTCLGLRKLQRRLEAVILRDGASLNQAQLLDVRDER